MWVVGDNTSLCGWKETGQEIVQRLATAGATADWIASIKMDRSTGTSSYNVPGFEYVNLLPEVYELARLRYAIENHGEDCYSDQVYKAITEQIKADMNGCIAMGLIVAKEVETEARRKEDAENHAQCQQYGSEGRRVRAAKEQTEIAKRNASIVTEAEALKVRGHNRRTLASYLGLKYNLTPSTIRPILKEAKV